MKSVRGDGKSSERDGRLFGVDLSEADKEVDTGGVRTTSDDIDKGGLHDGCFKSGDGLFLGVCSHRVSKSVEYEKEP